MYFKTHYFHENASLTLSLGKSYLSATLDKEDANDNDCYHLCTSLVDNEFQRSISTRSYYQLLAEYKLYINTFIDLWVCHSIVLVMVYGSRILQL